MAKIQQASALLSEGDLLRASLARAEALMAQSTSRAEWQELLHQLDVAANSMQALSQQGVDVRAEQSRLDTLSSASTRHARRIVNGVGGSAAFTALKLATLAPAQSWWQLNDLLSAQSARTLRSAALVLCGIVLVLFLGYVFRETLFPPNPVRDAITDAEIALRDNNLPKAVAAIDAGYAITNANAQLALWRGVLAEVGQNRSMADAAFARAQASLSERDLRLERAQIYLRAGSADGALTDLNSLINTGDQGAELYFLRASVWEMKRDLALREKRNDEARKAFQSALADLEKSAALAEQQKNDTLVVTARVRMGMLMQQVVP